jgi:hypothetical protein
VTVRLATYRFLLRRGDEIVATGYLTNDEPLEVGQSLSIGNRRGVIQSIEPTLRDPNFALLCSCERTLGAPNVSPNVAVSPDAKGWSRPESRER